MGDMFVIREARLQDAKTDKIVSKTDDTALQDKWEEMQQDVMYAAGKAYKWAIDNGIAKEQARAVLPEGCTKTRLYMNGSLRSWILLY